MHKNLIAVQERMVQNIRESLDILEVPDQKYLVLPALAVAEKPLSASELAGRTGLEEGQIRHNLDDFLARGVVLKEEGDVYELNPEMDKIIAGNIQSKVEALRKIHLQHVSECESLLESGKKEYDPYDLLMSKYLKERLIKMKWITAVMTRRHRLLHLLNPDAADGEEMTKITIH
jgi:hypothetical protein